MTKLLPMLGLAAVLALLLTLPQACYYENEEELYPGSTTCDTTGITYTAVIAGIIQNNCSGPDCHGAEPNLSGYPFDNYQAIRNYALGPDSKLLERINDAANPMPKGGPLLPECERAKIRAWVNAGAPE